MIKRVQNTVVAFAALFCLCALQQAFADSVEFDDYVIHYSAFRADTLSPEMATQYGLTRSNYMGVLNLSVQKLQADGLPQSVMAQVTGQAVNDAGQLKVLQPRQVKEGPAIYYISEFRISNLEELTFSIRVQTADADQPMELTFKQMFFTR